jgi:hypothetical protein
LRPANNNFFSQKVIGSSPPFEKPSRLVVGGGGASYLRVNTTSGIICAREVEIRKSAKRDPLASLKDKNDEKKQGGN